MEVRFGVWKNLIYLGGSVNREETSEDIKSYTMKRNGHFVQLYLMWNATYLLK
jgi:hypothetical protein